MKKCVLLIILCFPFLASAENEKNSSSFSLEVTPVTSTVTPVTLPKPVMDMATETNDGTSLEHWVWKKIPLSLPLTVGQERVLFFPSNHIAFDPAALSSQQLRIQSAEGAVYLKPLTAFPTTRMMAQDLTTGDIYFFDVTATNTPQDNSSIQIVNGAVPNLLNSNDEIGVSSASQPLQNNKLLIHENEEEKNDASSAQGYPALVRYAVQQLYAPERLLTPMQAVQRVPMYTQTLVPLFVGAQGGGALLAHPVATWTNGTFFVTAVTVKNTVPWSLAIDPRMMLGMWVAVAFFPKSSVQAAGNLQDRTTIFLVSTQPFAQALGAPNGNDA